MTKGDYHGSPTFGCVAESVPAGICALRLSLMVVKVENKRTHAAHKLRSQFDRTAAFRKVAADATQSELVCFAVVANRSRQ